MKKTTVFDAVNVVFLSALSLLCLLPLVHVFAVSLSDRSATNLNVVGLWPVGFQTSAYARILQSDRFFGAFIISVLRTAVGTLINMVLVCLTAFPLSKDRVELRGRNVLMWFFFLTMLINGGLIPTFLQVRNVGLLDSFWALIIPQSLNVFNMIVMMNAFRQLPSSLIEAAEMDGARHLTVLVRIALPLSMATVATLALFSMVFHWNEWFLGMIYLFDPDKWPLQTYVREITLPTASIEDLKRLSGTDLAMLQKLSDKSFKAAQLFIATLPILMSYPFLQKYFVKGLIIGSIKG